MKIFNEREIYEIYINHVNKPQTYYEKYEKIPLELNNKKWKWEGKDFPRIWCLLDFQDWLSKHNLKHFGKVLSLFRDDVELEYITWDKIDYAPYYNGNNDLHTLDLEEKEYDLVVFNQTLEHLYNPFLSMEKLFMHVKKGGYVFTSVPTINIPHMTPFHFNGLTPMGLCMLMESVGFETMELGFWGNVDYIKYIFEKLDWPDYRELMRDGIIKNEKDRNVQCWILAKKP